MPQELGLPRFLDKEADVGKKVVCAGEYVGFTVDKKYNTNQHNFFEVGGDHVVLSGGGLDWRENNGQLERGKLYDITFTGMKEIDKGQWAGQEAKQYEYAVYTKVEVAKLLEDNPGYELRGSIDDAASAPVPELPTADASESLGSLE